MSRSNSYLIATTVAVLILTGLAWKLPRLEEVHTLRVGRVLLPSSALGFIAEDQGYFEQLGVRVDYRSFAVGKDSLEALLRNEVDLAISYQTPVLLKGIEGLPLRILSTIHTSTRSTGVVARKDRGITSLYDLMGRRVGTVSGTTSDFFLLQLLRSQGLPLPSRPLYAEARELMKQYRAGDLDAIVLWEPLFSTARDIFPEAKTAVFYSDAYTDVSMVVGLDQTVQGKKAAIVKYLRALRRSMEFATRDREGTLKILSQHFSESELAAVRRGWADTRLELRLDNVLLSILEEQAILLTNHLDPLNGRRLSIGNMIWTSPLEEVDPEAVTIISPKNWNEG